MIKQKLEVSSFKDLFSCTMNTVFVNEKYHSGSTYENNFKSQHTSVRTM